SSGLQGQHGHLRTDPETEAKTEAYALVHINLRLAVTVHAGGEAAGAPAQGRTAHARQMHLPSVRVAAEHQVTAPASKVFDRARIMGQNHTRHRGRQRGERAVK